MKTILSRLTMKHLYYSFDDIVSGKSVHEYIDGYGVKYLANYPFRFWSYRVEKYKFYKGGEQ